MREQLELFGMFCLLGMGAAGTYDGLRLIRRQRPCGLFRVSVEDALFWLALAAGTFGIFYEKNSGNLRFYGFIGIFLGGFKNCALGLSAALVFSYIASLICQPKMKKH